MTSIGAPAIFVADSRGLDFLNSIATPVDRPVEWIDSGEGLLDWLDQAGLVNADVLDLFRRASPPAELDAIAAEARLLREWFRDFVLRHRGGRLDASALAELEPINRILARDDQYVQIVSPSDGLGTAAPVLSRARRWRTPESLLLPLAEAIADLVCHEGLEHVKHCEGHQCTLTFLDRTRGRRRRWCSMAVCGNRAKQTAHRERANALGPSRL